MDNWICNKIEQLCHKLQRNFGITIRTLKGICLLVFIGSYCMIISYQLSNNMPGYALIDTIIFVIFALGLIVILVIDIEQKSADNGFANPLRVSRGPIIGRYIMYGLFLGAIELALVSWYISNLNLSDIGVILRHGAAALFLVLSACTPLPPQKSRLREWFNNLSQSRQMQPAKIPTKRFSKTKRFFYWNRPWPPRSHVVFYPHT